MQWAFVEDLAEACVRAIEVPEAQIPLRFRSGARAALARQLVNSREQSRYRIAQPLASKLGRRRGGRGGAAELV